jgi:Zn-dependent protease
MSETTQALLIVLPAIFVSMVLHEIMHAVAADKLGDPTAKHQGRISLNPLVHIDPFYTLALPLLLVILHSPFIFGAAKPVQVNFARLKYDEFGGALVGAIGPLTNLAIAVAASAAFKTLNFTPGSLGYKVIGYTILVNIGFFVFNMIPWPPLDGSRVLYAFAPRPLQEIMERIEYAGISGLFIFMFIFYYLFSPILGNMISSILSSLAPGFLTSLGL